jgi:uncharacterized protein YjbI with pentapeptide repeats
VRGVEVHQSRRNGFDFLWLVDGGEHNFFVGDMDDHAAAREIRHNFLGLLWHSKGRRGRCHSAEADEYRREQHMPKQLHRFVGYQDPHSRAIFSDTSITSRIASKSRINKTPWYPLTENSSKLTIYSKAVYIFMGLRKTKSIKHNGKKLVDILEAHERFFSMREGGERADLTGADLSNADLSGVNLSGVILRNANLQGSSLRKARLPGADLSGANLQKTDLRNTDMTEAILPGANLQEAQASGVEFFRCDLSNADFRRAILRNGNFRLANVHGAKFTGADMGTTILRETDLTGADLSDVDLSTTLLPKGYAVKQSA